MLWPPLCWPAPLWGFLPAFFKAKWNTNETLFTLMMNYIATQLAAYFIIIWEVPKGAGKIGIINQDYRGRLAAPSSAARHTCSPSCCGRMLTGLMYIYLTLQQARL